MSNDSGSRSVENEDTAHRVAAQQNAVVQCKAQTGNRDSLCMNHLNSTFLR